MRQPHFTMHYAAPYSTIITPYSIQYNNHTKSSNILYMCKKKLAKKNFGFFPKKNSHGFLYSSELPASPMALK
jgi:hypothetical protein